MASNKTMADITTVANVTERPTNITIEELNAIETSKHIGVLIFCVAVMVVGILGNLLVLIIYKVKFKRTSARTYILALAGADLSVCIIGMPYHVLDLTMLLVYRYTYVCKVLSFLIGACTNSSIFILLVVGLDRYMKVCRPLKKQIVDFGDRRACLIAVVAAIVLSIPNAILYGHSTVSTEIKGVTGVECFIDDNFVGESFTISYMGLIILVFIMSLLYLMVIYGFICAKIYQQDKKDGEMNLNKKRTGFCGCLKQQDDDDDSGDESEEIPSHADALEMSPVQGNNKDEQKKTDENTPLAEGDKAAKDSNVASNDRIVKVTTKDRPRQKAQNQTSTGMIRHVQNKEKHTRKITLMMLTITVVFAISYLPFIIISILTAMLEDYWEDMSQVESVLNDLILRIYLVNNAVNPIIYSFWDLRFRRECLSLFLRMCGGKKIDRKSRNITSTANSVCTRRTMLSKTT